MEMQNYVKSHQQVENGCSSTDVRSIWRVSCLSLCDQRLKLMIVYVYRLAIEWARLNSDDRDAMTYKA